MSDVNLNDPLEYAKLNDQPRDEAVAYAEKQTCANSEAQTETENNEPAETSENNEPAATSENNEPAATVGNVAS